MRQTRSEHVAGIRYGPANRGRRAGGPGGRGQGVRLFEQLGRRLHACRADRPCCRHPGARSHFQRTFPGRGPGVRLAPLKRPMGSIVTSGTLRFECRAVEVVVASSSHGIEEPAPAPPNKPAVASPDASSGISCCMSCDLPFSLATQAACPPCQAHPCSGLFTGYLLCRCGNRQYAHMAIRLPSCGRSG